MRYYKILLPFSLLSSACLSAQLNPTDSIRTKDIVFDKVEVEAAYPGGDQAWKTYLMKNLNPDVPVENGAPLGLYTVVTKFIVSQDGTLADIQAETNMGYGMEKEVIRIIKNSGKWQPARQNGKTVNAYRRQPVSFITEEDGFEIYSKNKYFLFAGIDNEITVNIKKVKSADIKLSISKGSITPAGDGGFIARINETGRVVITAFSIRNDKELGKVSFDVRAQK